MLKEIDIIKIKIHHKIQEKKINLLKIKEIQKIQFEMNKNKLLAEKKENEENIKEYYRRIDEQKFNLKKNEFLENMITDIENGSVSDNVQMMKNNNKSVENPK